VLGGDSGVVAGIAASPQSERPVLVDMSTVGRSAALAAARAVEKVGGRFVDAPVSGSVKPAERGELVALVGGRVRDVATVEPVLGAMCKRILYAGGVGQGQALKVVLNGVGAHQFVAFTSMLALGERAGLSREVLVDAFTTGAFATPSYVGKKAKVLARDFSPEFSLALALKDCETNVELQREVGLKLDAHRACTRDVEAGVRGGLGELDLFALEKFFRARR
jgi:3-hydroxyisobutyrate dehydrogenase-like beta-hydroxyacid dehydrogenase